MYTKSMPLLLVLFYLIFEIYHRMAYFFILLVYLLLTALCFDPLHSNFVISISQYNIFQVAKG